MISNLLAQTSDVALDQLNIASVSGVVLASMFIVELLKRGLRNAPWFSKVPVFVYTAIVAAILAYFGNRILKTPDGKPYLAGASTLTLLWRAVITAAASSGLYTWLRNPETPSTAGTLTTPAQSVQKETVTVEKKTTLPLILLSIMFIGQGCTSQQAVPGTTTTVTPTNPAIATAVQSAVVTFNVAVTAVDGLHSFGVINDDQYATAKQSEAIAQIALQTLEDYMTGTPIDFPATIEKFWTALKPMLNIEHQGRTAARARQLKAIHR